MPTTERENRMNDEIKNKIHKLLELAKRGGTEAEATLAMQKAQEFLTKYNLSMSDIQTSEIKDEDVTEENIDAENRQTWQGHIYSGICALYFCQSYTSNYRLNGHLKTARVLVGKPTNIAVVKDVAQYLVLLGKELAEASNQGTLYRNSFKKGYSSRIYWRCNDQIKQAKAQISHDVTERALTVTSLYALTTQQNKDYLKSKGILLVNRRSQSSISDSNGYRDGQTAGNSVSLTSGTKQRIGQ